MVDEREILSKNVKNYREVNELSQFEFAEDCGITRETLSMLENAKNNVSIDTIQLVASRMGTKVSDLLSTSDMCYFVISSKQLCENDEQITYGIGAVKDNKLLDCVLNISADYNKVMSLVMTLEEENAEICHFRDIVSDYFEE